MKGKPLEHWKFRKRGNWPLMTHRLYDTLVALHDAKAAGQPFIELDIHGNTAKALSERDWAFKSDGLDGTRWTITGRGEKALKVYSPVVKRGDGLCPRCGLRPVKEYSTGSRDNYCEECLETMPQSRRKAQRKLRRKGEKKRFQAQRQKLLADGGIPKCIRRDCDQSARVVDGVVQELCVRHRQEYMNHYNDRRRPNSRAAKART